MRVLDADDKPVAGIEVYYYLSEEERWLKQFAQMKGFLPQMRQMDLGQIRHESVSKVSDASGLIDLPLTGVGFVSADSGEACNVELLQEYVEGTAQQVDLKLVPYQSLPVRVVHSDGRPASGYATQLLAVASDDSDETRSFGREVPMRTSNPTDADGRTSLRLELDSLLKEVSNRLPNPLIQVAVLTASDKVAHQTVDIDAKDEIELVLPDSGMILIHLQGFPESMFPRVSAVYPSDSGQRFASGLTAQDKEPKDAKWVYVDVPLGQEYSMAVHQRVPGKENSSRGTNFEEKRFNGPTKPGETVPIVLHYQQDAWLTAQLVGADGSSPIKALDGSLVSAWIWHPPNYMTALRLDMEVGNDGSLVAKAPSSDVPGHLAVPFSRLMIEYDPNQHGSRRNSANKNYLFADLELPSANPVQPYELGKVALESIDDLLTIQISDASGKPISRATAELEYLRRWGRGDRQHERWASINKPSWETQTNDEGAANIQVPNWRFACNIHKVYYADKVDDTPNELRLKVNHADYQSTEVYFDPSQKHIDVKLDIAASLSGGILKSERYRNMVVGIVNPGTPYLEEVSDAVYARGGGRGYSSRWEKLKSIPFHLHNIAPGVHDVVFFASNDGAEVHRISGVHLAAGENAPAALQDVDLMPYLDFVEVELLDEEGNQLRGEELKNLKIRAMRYSPDFKSGQGAGLTIIDDRIVLDIPIGGHFNGKIEVAGYSELVLKAVPAGIHPRKLSKYPVVRLRLSNADHIPKDARLSVYLRATKGRFGESLKRVAGSSDLWAGPIEGPGEYKLYISRPGGFTSQSEPIFITFTEEHMDSMNAQLVEIPTTVIQSFQK